VLQPRRQQSSLKQSLEKGNNRLNKIKHELEVPGMGDIWKNGGKNNKNVWREVKGVWILRDRMWKQV
jgi:hypothetical protein